MLRLIVWMLTSVVCFAESGATIPFNSRDARYRIQSSDVLDILFSFTPDFNQTVTVQPDGFISLRGMNQVKVAGLTMADATKSIETEYTVMLHDPVITLVLKEFSKPSFVIGGEITRPGKYDLHGELTLTDAVAMAGGFTVGAKSSAVLLFRRVSQDTVEVKKFNVKHMLGKGKLGEDPALRAGDSIYVSESAVGKIDRFMKISHMGLYFPLPAIP
ncbi:MAG: polysaccharide biosynthesis/export family protein [Bryobacteraceae bacterium]